MRGRNAHYTLAITVSLSGIFFVTILRGIRWPNDWAEAHWLISYQFGFVKRALLGTLIAPLLNLTKGADNAEYVIKILSSVFLLIFYFSLFWVCLRVMKKSGFTMDSILVVMLFLTSPYIVMSAHLNGYFDNIIIVIAILASVFVIRRSIYLASITMSVGVLAHETIFLVGFPSVIFLAFIQHVKAREYTGFAQSLRDFILQYGMLVFGPSLILAIVIVHQTLFLDAASITSQLTTHLSQFEFIQNNRNIHVPRTLTASFFDYLQEESPKFFRRISRVNLIFNALFPVFILLSYIQYRMKMLFVFNKLTTFTLVAVVMLPLSLHIIAWDTSRIWTYPILVAMLGVWGVSETFPMTGDNGNKLLSFSFITIMVITYQILVQTPLMDGEYERFSTELRILFYMPLLVLIVKLAAKLGTI